MVRLGLLALVAVVLAGCAVNSPAPATQADTATDTPTAGERNALMRIKSLEKALNVYRVTHNDTYPATLDLLAEPDPQNVNQPYVTADGLLDPWDKPFQYDPAGTQNDALKPDLWCVTPDGRTIANFPVR